MASEISDDDRQKIIDALYAGRKIEAVKIYRRRTSCDLTTAVHFVDELESRLRSESPEMFTSTSAGCGAAGIVLVIVAVLIAVGVALVFAIGKQQAPPAPAVVPAIAGPAPAVVQPPPAVQPTGKADGNVNASDPATPVDPTQELAAPYAGDLVGKWRLNLPAGFEHPAELERVDAEHYRLKTRGLMNGVYRVYGTRLIMETPVDKNLIGKWPFRWQIESDNEMLLIGQPDQRHVGGKYLKATLKRAQP